MVLYIILLIIVFEVGKNIKNSLIKLKNHELKVTESQVKFTFFANLKK